MPYNWISVLGNFLQDHDDITFKGGTEQTPENRSVSKIGNFISDQFFDGGTISGKVKFLNSAVNKGCEFIIFYDPQSKAFTSAGIGTVGLCSVRTFTGNQWINHASTGVSSQLIPDRSYELSVSVRGSRVTITLDGVNTLVTTLPFALPRGQCGIWCVGDSDIKISGYRVSRESASVFVIMQFTPPYNELYSDVIVPVCKELGLASIRADETCGPGLIVADISRQIIEAKVVIADITPQNPNVYYEVGYSHALNKPTTLIAENLTQLPFDVSPYRVLFYENTIGGKAKVESGLRKHLTAIQTQWSIP